jgi:arylsulfatase A
MPMRISCLLFALACAAAQARPALDKPNIVVVLLDDSGYGDFSHTGNPTIHTPNVSRMVRAGANFPQFYSGSPACSASRYALITGRNPRRSGLNSIAISPTAERYIHTKEVTLAEGLKESGYATGFFGKWHLGNPNKSNGNTPEALPLAHGFEVWEGTNVSNDYDPSSNLIRSKASGAEPVAGYEIIERDICSNVPLQEGLTRRYRDLGIQFIKDHKEKPFLLYIAPNMPHLPVHAGKAFQGKSQHGPYGDCIEEIDEMMGALNDALEKEGIAQNTLVILTSDNGPWIAHQNDVNHPRYGEARRLVGSALPFRDGKGSTWEGGVREVGVWYWPGTILPGTVVRQPASTMDVLPTAFALAGEPLPADRTIDGRDIRSYLNPSAFEGTVSEFRYIYTGNPDSSIYGARVGPWKLHTRLFSQTGDNHGFAASNEKPLLFNVEEDPYERIDRASEQSAKVSELKEAIDAFKASVAAEKTFWD